MAAVRDWVADLDLNPGRGFFSNLLVTVLRPIGLLPPRTVHWIALGTVAFAALELTEAVGLARRRRWAEYLTVMAGTIGIPFELDAVRHHVTVLRVSFLLINVAIVLYLAWQKHLFGLQGGRAIPTPLTPSGSAWRVSRPTRKPRTRSEDGPAETVAINEGGCALKEPSPARARLKPVLFDPLSVTLIAE
jgi:uncharacterized membrane protein (DUF2068 family)